ncbi:hypothetical protein CHUAL_010638 [Chamberlinius hualienensis]
MLSLWLRFRFSLVGNWFGSDTDTVGEFGSQSGWGLLPKHREQVGKFRDSQNYRFSLNKLCATGHTKFEGVN